MSALAPSVERVAIRDALPNLSILSACVVAIGICYMIEWFVRGLFGTVEGAIGWIPFSRKIVAAPVHKIEQKITHALGQAERGLDKRIGASFHKLARIARQLPVELAQQAALVFTVAAVLDHFLTLDNLNKIMRKALGGLWGVIHGHTHRLDKQAQTAKGHARGIHHAQTTAHTADARAIALPGTLPRTSARDRAQDASLGRVWRWIKHRRTALTTGAFIGAFVWALGRLGIGSLRCSRNKRIAKELCTPKGDFLLDLLQGGVLIVGGLSIVELAKELQGEMELATKGIDGLIRETH